MLPTSIPFVKILISAALGHVPVTVTGLVLNVCPFDGEVMTAGLAGRGPGTTADTA